MWGAKSKADLKAEVPMVMGRGNDTGPCPAGLLCGERAAGKKAEFL